MQVEEEHKMPPQLEELASHDKALPMVVARNGQRLPFISHEDIAAGDQIMALQRD